LLPLTDMVFDLDCMFSLVQSDLSALLNAPLFTGPAEDALIINIRYKMVMSDFDIVPSRHSLSDREMQEPKKSVCGSIACPAETALLSLQSSYEP
jgi:hypothetical protein